MKRVMLALAATALLATSLAHASSISAAGPPVQSACGANIEYLVLRYDVGKQFPTEERLDLIPTTGLAGTPRHPAVLGIAHADRGLALRLDYSFNHQAPYGGPLRIDKGQRKIMRTWIAAGGKQIETLQKLWEGLRSIKAVPDAARKVRRLYARRANDLT